MSQLHYDIFGKRTGSFGLVDTPCLVILAYFIKTSPSFPKFVCAIHNTIPKRISHVLIGTTKITGKGKSREIR